MVGHLEKLKEFDKGLNIMPEKICQFCKKEIAIVKIKLNGKLFHNEQMYVCGNCRDNLDDEIKSEIYENKAEFYKKYGNMMT